MYTMHVYLVAKDELEAQGIRWMIESHFTGVTLTLLTKVQEVKERIETERVDLVILDMDRYREEGEYFDRLMSLRNVRWLFLSSERMFQIAYRALQFRAEDILFRPFAPEDLMKHLQQIRFYVRNQEDSEHIIDYKSDKNIDYPDLFMQEHISDQSITMAAFLTPDPNNLTLVHEAVKRFSFTGQPYVFALSNLILCVQETGERLNTQEEYQAFLTDWKKKMDEPLAIVVKSSGKNSSIKQLYQELVELSSRIFYEGYDIIIDDTSRNTPQDLDPFLTPLEQRQWIEMLEKRDLASIREWLWKQFLTFKQPYPDPEIIRIRLTSVLAQIRRHMKSYQIASGAIESFYHRVFQDIIHQPVVYQIVQQLLTFTTELLEESHEITDSRRTFFEKARELMESNYWDPQWSLEQCAEALRMNKSTLSRKFKAECGKTFRDTLHEIRIREAKRMLLETDLSLEEISSLTGYSHQTYFNAKFKLLERCTPTSFRSGA